MEGKHSWLQSLQKLCFMGIRPPHSSSLSPYDFDLIGHLKSMLDSIRVSSKEELKANI